MTVRERLLSYGLVASVSFGCSIINRFEDFDPPSSNGAAGQLGFTAGTSGAGANTGGGGASATDTPGGVQTPTGGSSPTGGSTETGNGTSGPTGGGTSTAGVAGQGGMSDTIGAAAGESGLGGTGSEGVGGSPEGVEGSPEGVGGSPEGVGGSPEGVGGSPEGVGGSTGGVGGSTGGVGGSTGGVGGSTGGVGGAGGVGGSTGRVGGSTGGVGGAGGVGGSTGGVGGAGGVGGSTGGVGGAGGVGGSTGGVGGSTGGVGGSTGGVGGSTGGVGGSTGGLGGIPGEADSGGQEVCPGDSPTRIDVNAQSAEGVTLHLCPGVYTTSPMGTDEAGADAWLGWSPYSGNSGCSGDTECDCTDGWGYNYVIDVAGDRLRGIRSPVTNGSYCPTAQLAFERLSRVATFTLTEEADVTFRVTDTQPTENRGGMTLELTRVPWVPLSLEGLVAYWPFDTDALDASGNGFDLEEGLVTYREYGRLGESLVLDGTVDSNARGARVDGVCTESLGLDQLPVTVGAWVRPFAGASVGQAVFASQDTGLRHVGVSVLLIPVSETTMQVSATFGDGTLSSVSGRATVRTDGGVAGILDWHHVGVVFRGLNNIEIYVDGVRVPANDMEGAALVLAEANPPECPAVGYRSSVGTERYYSGEIDEVYVFSRALSATEMVVLAQL